MRPRQYTNGIPRIAPETKTGQVMVIDLQWVESPAAETWVEADSITEMTDLADIFIETYRQGILYENHLHLQQQREHAEQRRKQGLAGICESCGDWIAPERLEIAPYATRCVTCQNQYEKRNAR